MAFKKVIIQDETDVVVEHWDLLTFFYDKQSRKCMIVFGGWKSKASKNNGKGPVIVKRLEVADSEFNLGGIKNKTEELIKALPEFSGSQDD